MFFLSMKGIENLLLNNVFIIFEVITLFGLYGMFGKKRVETRFIFIAIIVVFQLWIFEWCLKGIHKIFSITSLVESILLILFGFYFLYQLVGKAEIEINKQFKFWTLIGIVMFFSTYIIFGSILTLVDTTGFDPKIITILATLPVAMNLICLTVYIKAFQCKM